MESNVNTISTGASAWAGSGMPMTVSPKPQHGGSGLPFAGYAIPAPATKVRTALRTADVKVPDPRGRKR